MHGGQGQAAAIKFFQLSPRERLQVEAFLKSLVAPCGTGPPAAASVIVDGRNDEG